MAFELREPSVSRADYEVVPIPHAAAKALVQRLHYSGDAANTSVYAHGLVTRAAAPQAGSLFDERLVVGAALWMPPAAGAAKFVAKALNDALAGVRGAPTVLPRQVLALSRLVVEPAVPFGGATLLLGGSVRLIERDRREGAVRYPVLVTYADEGQGHTGVIYRATGWVPCGTGAPTVVYVDAAGRHVSPINDTGRVAGRRKTSKRSRADMESRGFRLVGKTTKRRFVKVIGTLRKWLDKHGAVLCAKESDGG